MIDLSLAKAFGVLFEAPWMKESRFRSLDGVFGAVGGLCEASSEVEYGFNIRYVAPGEV
jgi:hypothetical protein